MIEHVMFDPNVIPDEKTRLKKEALECFRIATHTDLAISSLEYNANWIIKDEKIRKLYMLAIMNITKDQIKLIEMGIEKWNKSKEK